MVDDLGSPSLSLAAISDFIFHLFIERSYQWLCFGFEYQYSLGFDKL